MQKMEARPKKVRGLKWEKKDWRYIVNRKKFKIYSMRVGQNTKYMLSFNSTSFMWSEIGAPGRSSWEMAEDDRFLYFRMLIDGSPRTNVIKQKKDVKL